MQMTIEKILKESPDVEGLGGGKWAFYSIGCCWWTSFPEDMGEMPPVRYDHKSSRVVPNPGGHQLPCCPHCHSLLMQAPLEKFIEFAKTNPSHYGLMGMDTFAISHERNVHQCFRAWADYEIFIKPLGKDGVR